MKTPISQRQLSLVVMARLPSHYIWTYQMCSTAPLLSSKRRKTPPHPPHPPTTLLSRLGVSSGGSHIDAEEVWPKRNPDEAHKLCLLVIALSAILAHHQRFTRAVMQSPPHFQKPPMPRSQSLSQAPLRVLTPKGSWQNNYLSLKVASLSE